MKTCDSCHKSRPVKEGMPLHLIITSFLFQQWGLDYIGPINPPTRYIQAQFIIAAIKYNAKWPEAMASREATAAVTAKFLYQQVYTKYGAPKRVVSD